MFTHCHCCDIIVITMTVGFCAHFYDGDYKMRDNYVQLDINNKVLITGAAGFIGYHLAKKLLEKGMNVIGIDNLNDYYDVGLKESRLDELNKYPGFVFIRGNIADEMTVNEAFAEYKPDIVMNLAAQAGVRYSIDNPKSYIESNLVGFFNLLEACRHSYDAGSGYKGVKHLLFASSSSVYGNQKKTPFSLDDPVDRPISLYAATKKSNELMGYSYCHLYGIPMTGLRFFTVYGPLGRPDMAYFKFANKMKNGEAIQIYNNGDMLRDFTYIDDITEALERMLCNPPLPNEDGDCFKVYNIGNNQPEKLMDYIEALEKALGISATKEFLPMQPGDVYQTYADVDELIKDFDFKPTTTIETGLANFAKWYKEYYEL